MDIIQEATFTHAPTVDDQGLLVATDRQAGAVRGTLSPRTRGVSLGVSGRARRGVQKTKTEDKGKRPAPCACQAGAWVRQTQTARSQTGKQTEESKH